MFKLKDKLWGLRAWVAAKLLSVLPKQPTKPFSQEWLNERSAEIEPLFGKMSFTMRIMPPKYVTPADLDPLDHSDKPAKFVTPPTGELVVIEGAKALYVKAARFAVMIQRAVSPKYMKDELEYMTNPGKYVEVATGTLRALAKHMDSKFIMAVNIGLGGGCGLADAFGVVVWEFRESADELVSTSLQKMLLRGGRKGQLTSVLLNQWSALEYMTGGKPLPPMARQQLEKYGRAAAVDNDGILWVITADDQTVPNGTVYGFTDAEHLGANLVLVKPTVSAHNDAWMVSVFSYMSLGLVLFPIGQAARLDFRVPQDLRLTPQPIESAISKVYADAKAQRKLQVNAAGWQVLIPIPEPEKGFRIINDKPEDGEDYRCFWADTRAWSNPSHPLPFRKGESPDGSALAYAVRNKPADAMQAPEAAA